LTFSFNVNLKSNAYQCFSINAATTIDPTLTSTFFEIAYLDTNTMQRFASDFELLLLQGNTFSKSQYLGGTQLTYGKSNRATFPATYRQYITECVYWSDYTTPKILDNFNQVCIYNSCGSYGVYCPDSARFSGQVILHNFKTTTTPGSTTTFTPACYPKGSVYTSHPSMLLTMSI
jgi:hypothetical protein